MSGEGEPTSAPHGNGEDRVEGNELKKSLGLVDATMLVVSSVIGVGIFFTPGAVAAALPNRGWFFAAWLVGGLLSLAGALANAELGAMFPRAGGDYVYLREAYHPVAGFLVGWLSFFVIYAGTVATLAVGFADGVASFFPIHPLGKAALAGGVVVLTSVVNAMGVRVGAMINNVTALLKVLALAAIVIAGPLVLGHMAAPVAPSETPPPATLSFGAALSPVLFTYLGWNASVYVASEIRDVERTLPKSLFLGLGICTAIYLLVNATYATALPMSRLAGEGAVGKATATALFGAKGGTFLSLLILGSVLGALNANTLVGPRIAYAMAKDGLLFKIASRVHAPSGTPRVAIAVQGATALTLVFVFRSFLKVLDYTTFAIVLATLADTLALYMLRFRQPKRVRPYKAWGYPVVPFLYVIANLGIAIAMAVGRPLECAIGVGILLSGLPFYWAFTRTKKRSALA